jgi:exodeoxyribonuclease VII large subunit
MVASGLDAISPLATIERGFAIVTQADGSVVQDAAQLKVGDSIEARVTRGTVLAQVTGTR